MKRTIEILLILLCEFITSLILQFYPYSSYLLFGLFLLNIALLFFLVKEPYWKKGAWLVYLSFIEIMAYIINLAIFNILIFYFGLINLAGIFLAISVVIVAHIMKLNEAEETKEAYGEYEEPQEEKKEIIEEENKIETKKIDSKTYIATPDKRVHLEDCPELESCPENKRISIGSKRYARMKYDSCKICNPF